MKFSFYKIFEKVKKKYVYLIAVIGVLLIILPTVFENGNNNGNNGYIYTSEQYIEDTEEKLKKIISEMIGSKDVSVMITLESAVENVYADSTKINTNITENTGSGSGKNQQSDSKENEYIIVKDGSGNEQALVITQVMPQIRGVVIVCPYGDDVAVRETVKSAVVTVLNISSKKVCVVASVS